jgi:GntR family transcriptional regulator, transcriptional repressor for pyruvate dehydrogenase complex
VCTVFQQVRQSRIFQDVVDQIEEAIVQGKLTPGSRLPAERELTDIFKASRGTLREALRVLEQKGLISIKTGVKGGAVVNTLTTHQISESLDLLIRYQRVSLRDLAEFREGVEGMVAALAGQRATKEDIGQLKTLLKKTEQCLEQGPSGWDAFIRMDNQIHMALARMARNPVYESVLQTIYDNIHRYFDRFLPREEKIIQENYQDLCAIVRAVEKGDARKASLLVKDHVCRFNRRMEENAKGRAVS